MGRPLIKKQEDPLDKYREALHISKHQLDDAMITQPQLYQEVSEGFVNASSLRDASKSDLERLDAKIAGEIRMKLTKAGERFSETRVGDEVIQDPRHIAAYNKHQALVKRAALYSSLQFSFEQRGKMLRELGQLFQAGYFSQVEVRTSETSARDARASIVRSTLKQRRSA